MKTVPDAETEFTRTGGTKIVGVMPVFALATDTASFLGCCLVRGVMITHAHGD